VLGGAILFFQIPLNMKANELRIGNFVNSDVYGDYQVKGISFNEKGTNLVFKDFNHYPEANNLKSLKPIPLTEEWLLKFGFAYDGFCWSFKLHQIRLIVGSPYPYWIDSSYVCDIEYVHQLQNLYFALTQQELLLTT
jgi:hypothetical protein